MRPISILHIDECPVFQQVFSIYLREHVPEGIVIGTAENGAAALALAPKLRPDLIICNLSITDLPDVLPQLRMVLPETRIIGLTLFDGNQWDEIDVYSSRTKLILDLQRVIQQVIQRAP